MTKLVPFNRRNAGLLSTGFEDFHNMLDDFFSDNWWPWRSLERDTFKINVQQNEKDYLVEAELPGVNKDEIDLSLDEGRLTISVKREEQINEEKKNYIHRESRFSSMSRSIYLADADSQDIKAKLENGVLSILVPRQDRSNKAQRIEIQ
jgi:HSP20 family protein